MVNQEDRKVCIDVEVSSAHDGQVILMSGTFQDNAEWQQTLTKRAGHLLWSRLTTLLFPEKAQKVTAIVSTVPLSEFSLDPDISTHVEVDYTDDDYYRLTGLGGREKWRVLLNSQLVRRLWTALDIVLYPDGWETKTTHQGRSRRQTFQ